MGGFYGSVQVRTRDRAAVIAAATDAARAAGIRCLVGPEINGWIGVYPEQGGQDQGSGADMAARMGGEILHLLVHDDDVMAYWLWREGGLVDSYWSQPGYFDESQRAQQEQMAGNPAAFGELLRGRSREMAQVLERREQAVTFEMDRLGRFAGLLGISNAVTSYEYLKAGEVEGVERIDEFIDVPADEFSAEARARLERNAAVERHKQQLKQSYVLLTDVVEERLLPRACATADGFLVAWEGHGRTESRIELYRPPWGEAEPGEIETGGQVNCVASDADGSHIAMALGNRVVAWTTRGWKPLMELIESDWALLTALSADGKLLAYSSRQAVYVSEIGSGRPVTALGGREGSALAIHPSNEWIVSAGSAVWAARVDGALPWRELYVGGRAPLPGGLSAAAQKQMSGVDLEAMEKKWRDQIDGAIAQMHKPGKTAPPEMLANMRQQLEKQIGHMRAHFARLKEGNLPAPRRGNETAMTAGFSRDGRWMWCGTDKGLHVYEWSSVAGATGEQMPPAVWSYAAGAGEPSARATMVYAAIEEPGGNALVFGGLAGQLWRLDLATGQARELAALPDGGAIISLCISRDASAIGICSRPALGDTHAVAQDERAVWQIWSY